MIAGHLKMVQSTRPATGAVTLDLVRRRVAPLAGHRRARQRLASTPTTSRRRWIDDASFDIRHHVGCLSRRQPGGPDAYAGKRLAERLDHLRPLWCMDFAGPLDDGRTALVIRIHHCMADGVTACACSRSCFGTWSGGSRR